MLYVPSFMAHSGANTAQYNTFNSPPGRSGDKVNLIFPNWPDSESPISSTVNTPDHLICSPVYTEPFEGGFMINNQCVQSSVPTNKSKNKRHSHMQSNHSSCINNTNSNPLSFRNKFVRFDGEPSSHNLSRNNIWTRKHTAASNCIHDSTRRRDSSSSLIGSYSMYDEYTNPIDNFVEQSQNLCKKQQPPSNKLLERSFSAPQQSIRSVESNQSDHINRCADNGCRRVTLNVSGMHFETRVGVLEQHPKTLLGSRKKRAKYYDERRQEYFFDRHRPSFEAIFNYYQYGGKLKRPPQIPDDIFLDELMFYEIEKELIDVYKKDEGYVTENVTLPDNPTKRKIWMLFEFPETSTLAFLIAVFSVICTILSIILFCVETLPVFRESHCVKDEAPNFLDPFFIIETICTLWFTIELIVRFFVCPNMRLFVIDIKNLVDVAAIVPYYVTLFNVLISFSCKGAKGSASLAFLRVIRLIRVFKLTKHSSGLQVLILTFRASVEGLGLFLVALVVCILVFSSTIYHVESDNQDSQITSIPDAFWWAIITMCTVGYGDMVPVSIWGRMIGSVCALAGVLTLAIPVPIITENFNKFYAHKTGRGRL